MKTFAMRIIVIFLRHYTLNLKLLTLHTIGIKSQYGYCLFASQVQEMLDQLSGEWVAFQQCLIDSDAMLKKSKEKFKTGLIHSSEEFKKTVSTLFDEFHNRGPFSSSVSVKEVGTT